MTGVRPKRARLVRRNSRIVKLAQENPDLTRRQLSKRLRLSQSLVTNILKKHGVASSRGYSKEQLAKLADRNEIIRSMYTTEPGSTLEELGAAFGITRERARQVINKKGTFKKKGSHRVDILELVRIVRASRCMRDCTTKTGYHVEAIKQSLQELGLWEAVQRLWRIRKLQKKRLLIERSRVYLLEAMKQTALEVGHTPALHDFYGQEGRPWFTKYFKYFGSMAEAQRLAGLTPNEPGHPPKPLPLNYT